MRRGFDILLQSSNMAKSQADKQGGEAKGGGEAKEGEAKEDSEEAGKHEGEGKEKQQQTEEPKVKQVTFLETKKKEPRKRTRKIMNQLRDQMEFYFGDANLNKDRFMKQQTDSGLEGYIPISVFMTFRNIQLLTTDFELLVKALRLSSFLQVNDDGTKVRRTTPVKIMTQGEIDQRTVYVEGFHKFITREWIMEKFSKCGKVAYISLPRFKTSNEIKGYAFVEFESPAEALTAVKMLNSVPDEIGEKPEEKVAASVKQNKNLTYWKKKASRELDPADLEASLKEPKKQEEDKEGGKAKSKKKKKKNRSSLSFSEAPPAPETTTVAQKTDTISYSVVVTEESKENATKPEATSETDDTKVKKSKKSKKKRKRKSNPTKPTTEDGATQNVGDAESAAPKTKESEMSVKLEVPEDPKASSSSTADVKPAKESEEFSGKGGRKRQRLSDSASEVLPKESEKSVKLEVPEDPKASSSSTADVKPAKESEEFSGKGGRKRQRLSDSASEVRPSSAKIPKLEPQPGKESKVAVKKEKTGDVPKTCPVDTPAVFEVCDKSTPEDQEPVKDVESQQSGSGKGREQTGADAAQQCRQTDAGTAKRTASSQGDALAKQPETQKVVGKKKRMDSLDTSQEKTPKIKKQKEGSLGGGPSRPADGRKRKRKSGEGGDEGSGVKKKKPSAGSGSEVMSEAEDQDGKKKKRHRKHKMPEQGMRLRVMKKETWTQLKKEYLNQQKVNMKKLKDQLKEASMKRRQQQAKNKSTGGQQDLGIATGGRPAPEFVANVILEVKSEAELCLQTIKADVPPTVQVAYIDIRPGMTEGYIRCKDAESASKLLQTGLRGLSLSQMEGEAESQYWTKLIADRETKLSDSKRRKRRGKLKILQRAQNPHEEITQRQHLIFAEGDSQNPENMRDDFDAYTPRVHFSLVP